MTIVDLPEEVACIRGFITAKSTKRLRCDRPKIKTQKSPIINRHSLPQPTPAPKQFLGSERTLGKGARENTLVINEKLL
jgi:hypothetical protein